MGSPDFWKQTGKNFKNQDPFQSPVLSNIYIRVCAYLEWVMKPMSCLRPSVAMWSDYHCNNNDANDPTATHCLQETVKEQPWINQIHRDRIMSCPVPGINRQGDQCYHSNRTYQIGKFNSPKIRHFGGLATRLFTFKNPFDKFAPQEINQGGNLGSLGGKVLPRWVAVNWHSDLSFDSPCSVYQISGKHNTEDNTRVSR